MPGRPAVAALSCCTALLAHAGPPFVTDDPEPVGLRHWEINTAATASWRGPQGSFGLPSVDINYGAGENVQLHAQPRFDLERGGGTNRGIDDTEVGIKYRFVDQGEEGHAFMMGVYPMLRLATGARRLGQDRGTHGVFLPMWLQLDRGPWTAYGGVGYRLNREVGGRNSTFAGLTILREVREGLQVGVEGFHETSTATAARPTTGFNVGAVKRLTGRLNLLASIGRARSESPVNLAYLGLQVHF